MKSINLGATVPGLARLPAAQAWLVQRPNLPAASSGAPMITWWQSHGIDPLTVAARLGHIACAAVEGTGED